MGVCSDKWLGVAAPLHLKLIGLPFEDPFCSGGVPTAGKALDRGDMVATRKAFNGEVTIPHRRGRANAGTR